MRGSATVSAPIFSTCSSPRCVRINRHTYTQNAVANAQRLRVRHFVEAHLFNADLDATLVAAAVQITPRYVHRLFEGSGETCGQYVLRRRLDETAHRLRDPAHASRSAMEVAFDCGFTDASYFGRCFRRRFGMTPGDYRRSAGT